MHNSINSTPTTRFLKSHFLMITASPRLGAQQPCMIYARKTAMKQPKLSTHPRITTPVKQRNLTSIPLPHNLYLIHRITFLIRLLFSSGMVSNLTHHTVSATLRSRPITSIRKACFYTSPALPTPSRHCRCKEINLYPFVTSITLAVLTDIIPYPTCRQ